MKSIRPSNIRRFFGDLSRFKKKFNVTKFGSTQVNMRFINDDLDVTMGGTNITREQWVNSFKNNTDFELTPATIARYFYNFGMFSVKNNYLERGVFNEVEQYKDQFPRRLAFGFYHGALVLDSQPNIIYFARSEYEKFFVDSEDDEFKAHYRKQS